MLKSFIFFLIVVLIGLPHLGLHIDVRFLIIFALALVLHLLSEKQTHFLLLLPHSLSPFLLKLPLSHFSFVVVLCQHIFFEALPIRHFLQDVVRHFVHEVLSAFLPASHLLLSILFLLVKHAGVLLLRTQVVDSLLFLLLLQAFFVSFILLEHLLQVLLLLLPLLCLQLPLLLHFILQALDRLQLLRHLLFVLPPLSAPLVLELQITRKLIIHDFLFNLTLFLLFAFFEELVVLLSHLIIESRLILFVLGLDLFLLDLIVELLANQTFAFVLARDRLLLLFEVQQGVELLDCGPLVVLVDLRVLLGQRASLAGRCDGICREKKLMKEGDNQLTCL